MAIKTRLLCVLWIAGAISIICNVLAAEPTLTGRLVASWPPIALLLVVEVLARAPLPCGRLRWVAMAGVAVVALPAAVASFQHMHHVAIEAGESTLVAYLFPLTVDGLAVVASIALLGQKTNENPITTDAANLESALDIQMTPVDLVADSEPIPVVPASISLI